LQLVHPTTSDTDHPKLSGVVAVVVVELAEAVAAGADEIAKIDP
jgi:hypothetical protein